MVLSTYNIIVYEAGTKMMKDASRCSCFHYAIGKKMVKKQ